MGNTVGARPAKGLILMFSYTETRQIIDGAGDIKETFDIGFIGSPLDIRGRSSIAIVKNKAAQIHKIEYQQSNYSIQIDGVEHPLIDYMKSKPFDAAESVLIDATNLAFPEIAILLRLIHTNSNVKTVSFIYCEPEKYTKAVYTDAASRYELSDNIEEPQFIPSFFTFNRKKPKRLFAFLGFEARRFTRMVDPDDGETYESINPVFAVPPYQPGFEKVCFDENSRVLEKISNHQCHFVPSNHPYNALKLLRKAINIYEKADNDIVIAPLGNKPCTIAVAMIAAENENVSVIFDFPTKKSNRTDGVKNTYLFSALVE